MVREHSEDLKGAVLCCCTFGVLKSQSHQEAGRQHKITPAAKTGNALHPMQIKIKVHRFHLNDRNAAITMNSDLFAINFTNPSTLQPEHCLNHHQYQDSVNQHSTCNCGIPSSLFRTEEASWITDEKSFKKKPSKDQLNFFCLTWMTEHSSRKMQLEPPTFTLKLNTIGIISLHFKIQVQDYSTLISTIAS